MMVADADLVNAGCQGGTTSAVQGQLLDPDHQAQGSPPTCVQEQRGLQ